MLHTGRLILARSVSEKRSPPPADTRRKGRKLGRPRKRGKERRSEGGEREQAGVGGQVRGVRATESERESEREGERERERARERQRETEGCCTDACGHGA